MRFILLAISLFFANNTYAAVLNNLYIYHDDSNEIKVLKDELRIVKNESSEQNLIIFKNHRKTRYQRYAKDEIVYKVGDTSKEDVGTKIGMSKDQVLNKSYWGKPENIYTATDGNDKIELWTYEIHGERNGALQRDGLLFFINGKLTHRMP